MRKRLLVSLAVLLALPAILSLASLPARHAQAQTSGATKTATGHFSVTTAAVVATFSATDGPLIVIEEMFLTSETAGLMTLHNGTSGADATRIGIFTTYLEANKPIPIPPTLFQDSKSMRLTPGNSLYCMGPGVLHFVIKYGTR